jgi:putative ABC transport system permease protein
VDVNTVTPDYFATAGVPLRRGRGFSPADRSGGAPVTLISEGLARRSFGDRDPVGTRIALTFHGRTRDLEVVGVVGDVRRRALSVAPHPTVYLPFDQAPTGANAFFVRAGRDAEAAVRGARVVLGELLPGTSVARAETMDRVVGESVRERRFVLTLIGLFAVLALALASVGTFGVMSYSTAERTREIGVRMAFGAWGRDVILMVLGRGVRLAAAGIALGLLGALLLSRQLTGMLYEVRPLDAATFATSAALLFGAAIAACWLPAARAARLDPMDALRAE